MDPGKPMASIFKILIRGYQLLLSPVLAGRCRYEPTCSEYALGALDAYGPIKGLLLAIKRIGRCHPWGGYGYDPVPEPPVLKSGDKKNNFSGNLLGDLHNGCACQQADPAMDIRNREL